MYGYVSGDSVIKLFVEVIVEVCSMSKGFVGYIGGDDFMVVFDKNDVE